MNKFLIVDGNNIAYRAFYALPPLTDINGNYTNAIFGFVNILIKVIKDHSPTHIAVAFDKGKSTFRHKKYEQYKATRKPMPPELAQQMPVLKELLGVMNIPVLEREDIEADDIIGILCNSYKGTQNLILSADKDILQLIKKDTTVLVPQKGTAPTQTLTEENLIDVYGVSPSQVVELKALMGDASDNIPGVMGVGEKTAISLLDKYYTLDGVYENLDQITGKLHDKLVSDKDNAYLSKELATIITNMPLNYNLEDFVLHFPLSTEVYSFFERLQFRSLLAKELFESESEKTEAVPETKTVKIKSLEGAKKLCLNLLNKKIVAFHIEQDIYINDTEREYEIVCKNTLLDSGVDLFEALHELAPLLTDENVEKVLFNSKKLKSSFSGQSLTVAGKIYDLVLARYLLYAGVKSDVSLNDLLSENMLTAQGKAESLFALKEIYFNKLEQLNLLSLYYDVELPLVDVLLDMERTGFKIDNFELDMLEAKYNSQIADLTKNIYEQAGEQFNINSPKQLSEILFDKLKLSTRNNKKLSTNVDVLNDIYYQHPIVPLILDYRKYNKLLTTYIRAFKEIQNKSTEKIHTIFNQTLTATGRLSSSEPNLQNIPVRSEEGREIRKVFVSSFENGVIVSADYNQVELRLLANFSGDEKLINAYRNGEDIHRRTASEIFGVNYNSVDSEMRRNAKAINFGIIYGISDYGLSQNIGSTRAKASNFIKLYFEKYPSIEKYMKDNVEFCKKFGYAKTHFGRIRNVPEIHNSNYMQRQFGERVAMNMPLQGSASDIIKIAMIKVYNAINEQRLKSKLILQIHDELLVDTYPSEQAQVEKLLRENMENVVNLTVKLQVNISSGKNWFEAN